MFDLKLKKYKKGYYLVDNIGNMILKSLNEDQVIQVQEYRIKWIKSLSKIQK